MGPFLGAAAKFIAAVFVGAGAGASAAYVLAVNVARLGLLALTAKLSAPKVDLSEQAVTKTLTVRDPIAPQKFVYGEDLVGGPLIFANVSGTDNRDLYLVEAWTGHEIDSVQAYRIDDTDVPLTDLSGAEDGNYTGGKFNGVGRIVRQLGTSTQAAIPDLTSEFPTLFGANHTGRGWSHALFRFDLIEGKEDVFKTQPQNLRALIRGYVVYDTRLDTSPGADPDNAAYQTWSDNPALCLAHWLRDQKFGMRETNDRIDWDLVDAAADICDQLVDVPPAASPPNQQKRYTCNVTFNSAQPRSQVRDEFVNAMLGRLVFSQGKWRMWAGAAIAPDVTLTEANLRGGVSVQTETPSGERYNRVRGKFIDAARNYTAATYPEQRSSTFETDDGGDVNELVADFMSSNSDYEAQRKAIITLRKSRNHRVVVFEGNISCFRIQPGTTVQLTVDELGFAGEKFFVTEWKLSQDGVDLTMVQEDDTVWNDPAVGDYTVRTATGALVFGETGVPAPTALTATAIFEGVALSWTNPALNAFKYIEVWANDDNDRNNAVKIAEVEGEDFTETLYENPRTRYYWIRAVNEFGEVSAYEPNLTTTTATAGPRPPSTNIIVDPDFDKSTGFGAGGGGFWGINTKDGGTVTFVSGGGANSSNAVDLNWSAQATSVAQITGLRRHRLNHGKFQFRIRYQTMQNGDALDHPIRVGVRRYTAETGGTANDLRRGPVTLPRSFGSWATAVIDFPITDNPTYQYFSFTMDGWPSGESADDMRVDSIFVYPGDETFGDYIFDGDNEPGLVPKATAADISGGKFLKADATWDTPAGSGGLPAGTVDQSLLVWDTAPSPDAWVELTEIKAGVTNNLTGGQLVIDGSGSTTEVNSAIVADLGNTDQNILAAFDDWPTATTGAAIRANFNLSDANHTLSFHMIGPSSALQPGLELEQDGFVHFLNRALTMAGTALLMNEQAAQPSVAAGRGGIWVKNDAPSTLWFTDDTGADYQLGTAAGGGGGPSAKASVRAATTANITLSGTQTVDGVALAVNDRCLVKNQTSAQNNGIYNVKAGAWTRASNSNTAAELAGSLVSVRSGTVNGGTVWQTTFKGTDTLGTTAMSWFRMVVRAAAAPADNQVAVWTNAGTIEGDGNLTWDGTNLSATQFGGIAEADLLDKSATEQIDGAWTFTNNVSLLDNDFLRFGAAADVTIGWDGVDLEIGALAGGSIVNFRDGINIRAWDSTDTDYVALYNDGTDSWLDGLNNRWLRVASDFDRLQVEGGVLGLVEIAAAPADTAGVGQVWVRNDVPNTLMFTDDAGTDFDLTAAPDVDRLKVGGNDALVAISQGTLEARGSIVGSNPPVDTDNGTNQVTFTNSDDTVVWGTLDVGSGAFGGLTLNVRGQNARLRATKAAGGLSDVFSADPDAGALLPYNGGTRFATIDAGIRVSRAGTGATLYLEEVAAAYADVAGDGQIWVKNDVPNTLWFTDDAGNDFQLGASGPTALNDLSDVDLTGAADNDLLYRSGGNWIDTAGQLQFDGTALRVYNTGATRYLLLDGPTEPRLSAIDVSTGDWDNLQLTGEQVSVFTGTTAGATRRFEVMDTGAPTAGGTVGVLGLDFRVYDGVGRTDYLQVGHDGTDVNLSNVNTTDWNITGLTGAVNSDAPLRLQEQASPAANATGYGQFWVDSSAAGGHLPIFTSDQGFSFAMSNRTVDIPYRYDSAVTEVDPGSGDVRFDNTVPASITEMYISDLDLGAINQDYMLNNLSQGDLITVRDTVSNSGYLVLEVSGAPVDNTGWWSVPVTPQITNTIFVNNDPVLITVHWFSLASSANSLGALTDVDLTGAADSDLLYRSAGNWIDTAGALTWNGTTLEISLASPTFQLRETDGALDEKVWRVDSFGSDLRFTTRTDAGGGGVDWLNVRRGTGTAVTQAEFGVPVRFEDSGRTDYIQISHNGQYAELDFLNTDALRVHDVDDMRLESSLGLAQGGRRTTFARTDANSTDGFFRVARTDAGISGRGGCRIHISPPGGNAAPCATVLQVSNSWNAVPPVVTVLSNDPTGAVVDVRPGYDATDARAYIDIQVNNGTDTAFYVTVDSDVISGAGWEAFAATGVSAPSSNYIIDLDTDNVLFGSYGGVGEGFIAHINPTTPGFVVGLVADQVNDRVEMWHDGSDGFVATASGILNLGTDQSATVIRLVSNWTVAGQTSGAEVRDHAGNLRDVGFNDWLKHSEDATVTLSAELAGGVYFKDGATGITLTLEANTSTDFPVDAVCTIVNANASGNIVVSEGTGTTLYILTGTQVIDSAGSATVGPGGYATLWREDAAVYYIMGAGVTT